MMIRTNAAANRKDLVKAMSDLLNEKPRYCFAPSFAYEFGVGTLDKEATIHLVPSLNAAAAETLAKHLAERGFTSTVVDEGDAGFEIEQSNKTKDEVSDIIAEHFTVCIEKERLSEEVLAKLKAVIVGKATLLGKAFGADELSIIELPTGYAFPWFEIESADDERAAYTELIDKLIEFAGALRRVTAKDKEIDNPKYAMRCFLLRLGFIGDEFKTHRAVLLRNLDGNSAFRSGSAPKRQPRKLSNQDAMCTEISEIV